MKNNKNKSYNIVRDMSYLIRLFFTPNPFIFLENIIEETIYNCIIYQAILHFIVFSIVGMFYKKGSNPVLGSLLYLFVYITISIFLGNNMEKIFECIKIIYNAIIN